MKTKRAANKSGIKGYTITPWTVNRADGWVLNYSHHGSSYVHAEEFNDLDSLNARLADLQNNIQAQLKS